MSLLADLCHWLEIDPPVFLHEGPRGRGLYAKSRDTSVELIRIERKFLLNTDTVAHLSPSRTFNATQMLTWLLAAYKSGHLANSFYAPYFETLPWDFPTAPLQWEILGASVPYDVLYASMPRSLQTFVNDVSHRFHNDCKVIQSVHDLPESKLVHPWLIVNSRCIFYQTKSPRKENHLTLCPLLDMINHGHTQPQCIPLKRLNGDMSYSAPSYLENLQESTELLFSYGPHSDAFLLAEYGFTMGDNPFNYVSLDADIAPRLSRENSKVLSESGYYGDWNLVQRGDTVVPDHRLSVALRLMVSESEPRWRAYMNGIIESMAPHEEFSANALLTEVVASRLSALSKMPVPSCPEGDAIRALYIAEKSLLEKCQKAL